MHPVLCAVCRLRPYTRLCDHEIVPGQTCDAKLCEECVQRDGVDETTGADRDLCPVHAPDKAG